MIREINYEDYINRSTLEFSERDWVFENLNSWLDEENPTRFFILTGEPGSGKTTIAARLVQFSQGTASPPHGLKHLTSNFLSAHHFCSAGDNYWINPRTFVESISLQLSRNKAFASALAEVIEKNTAAINQEVNIKLENVSNAQVTGIIQYIRLSEPSPRDAFDRIVRAPLELLQSKHEPQIIILVDGLDEALIYGDNENIVELIKNTGNLDNVRFILTSISWKDIMASSSTPGLNFKECSLSKGDGHLQSLNDIRLYAKDFLDKSTDLKENLASDIPSDDFINALERKSEGNFLYAQHLLKMIQGQSSKITKDSLEQIPAGLDGVYVRSLEQLKDKGGDKWKNEYAPILGTLAVAQAPLKEAQLKKFTGINDNQILYSSLDELRCFLDVDDSLKRSDRRYTIYHHSLAELLMDIDRAEFYHCEENAQHKRIVDYYSRLLDKWENYNQLLDNWKKFDDYGLDFIIHHIMASQEFGVLNKILTTQFIERRLEQSGWHMPFVLDLERVSKKAPPEQVAELCLKIIYGRKPNSLVNQRILKLLIELKPKLQAMGKQIGRPSSEKHQILDETVSALALPSEEAVPILVSLMDRTKNPDARGIIALALGETKSKLATIYLMNLLRNPEKDHKERKVSWCAADALIALNDRSIIPELISLFDNPIISIGLKQRILYIMGMLRVLEARDLVLKGLDSKWQVQSQAIKLIWLLDLENGEKILWEKLGFCKKEEHYCVPAWSNELLQQRLVIALGHIGSPNALKHLKNFERKVKQRPEPREDKLKLSRRLLLKGIEGSIKELTRRSASYSRSNLNLQSPCDDAKKI